MSSIAIVGPGRAGLSLAAAFARSGAYENVVVFGRHREAPDHPVMKGGATRYVFGLEPLARDTEVVFLAVPDDAVPEVAHALAGHGAAPPGCAALHLSGALPTDVLEPLHHQGYGVGAFHPMVAFTEPHRASDRLAGAFVAVTAGPEPLRAAHRAADALGAEVLSVPAARRPLFHAATSLLGAAVVPVLVHAAGLVERAGVGSDDALAALSGLARSTLETLQEGTALHVGPIARADAEAVALHLRALEPEERTTYARFALELLRLGEAGSGVPDEGARRALSEMLERHLEAEITEAGVGH